MVLTTVFIAFGLASSGCSESSTPKTAGSGSPDAIGTLKTVRVASGLAQPLFLTYVPGDSARLFILEQNSGKILILKNESILSTPFLNIGSLLSTGGERGLLGLAFHPNYPNNGFFYVNYTNTSGNTVIARYTISANPDLADPSSAQTVLTIDQPFSNHNGGIIAFGPDGYLYIGTGDGGSGGDPGNRAQSGNTLLGKILRIDIDGGSPYAVPPDNPFVGSPDFRDEIWAYGLRNPWRFSFDKQTGDMFIGDVGQNIWEEVDFQPASSNGGENYGWRCYEGNHAFNTTGCGSSADYVFPIHEYSHGSGDCSITGGHVYRGCAMPDMGGTYFFGDFCSGRIWSFKYDGANMTEFTNRTAELAPGSGLAINMISSFGTDIRGEIYILDYGDGEIYKIVPADGVSMCTLGCGDTDGSASINLLDALHIIDYLYKGGAAPILFAAADVNGSGTLNLLDVTYFINYLYKAGPALTCLF